jgi:hypothetical protein
MDSNSSFSSEFFFGLALFGAALVIIGVLLEAAELIVKLGSNVKYGKWVSRVFGKKYRLKIALLAKFLHPRILPFEAIGFGLLFIGLAIELIGSFVAERLQSKENLVLQNRVEVLRKANDELEAAARDRTISEVQSNLFMVLTKDLPKTDIKVTVGLCDYETQRYAQQIRTMLTAAGYGKNGEKIVTQGGGMIIEPPEHLGAFSSNDLAFVVFGDPAAPVFYYSSEIWSNNPELGPPMILGKVQSAFATIGIVGAIMSDNKLVNRGEVCVFVPLKKH